MTEPGGFLHATDPFAAPESTRSPVRRLRGRLPQAVTLWTAPGPAGLTVSSTLVVDGEPAAALEESSAAPAGALDSDAANQRGGGGAHLLGVLDEESELWAAASAAGRFAVAPLRSTDRQLADRFAGIMPAPGGLFSGYEWRETPYGPVLAGLSTWAGCRLDEARSLGWGLLITGTIETVEIGRDDAEPLIYFRGRYRGLDSR